MEVWRFIFYKLCGKIQNKYFKKEDRKKKKKQMIMMTMKKMKMMMMRRKHEEDEETLIGSPSSSDLEMLIGSPSPSSPDLRTRTNLIRRIADAVASLARSVTAAVAGSPDNIPVNNVGHTNRNSDNAAKEEYEYDGRKCVVGSERTYCRNCRRYHHALVSL